MTTAIPDLDLPEASLSPLQHGIRQLKNRPLRSSLVVQAAVCELDSILGPSAGQIASHLIRSCPQDDRRRLDVASLLPDELVDFD